MSDFEKQGVFYLGRRRDWADQQTTDEPVLYDSRDLTTHAVVVGMTGSGKTGLCITLLEEAALDGIPALVIDPKGDIANLLLTFPELSAADFRPWVDEGEAARKGKSLDEFAAAEAARWRDGLGRWGQDGQRIRALRESVEMRLYTPGSSVGRPLTILNSFSVPPANIRADDDLFREHIAIAVSGLLTLLGLKADPLQSREHILLSNILEIHWRAGRSVEIGKLIQDIQAPPFPRVGVLETDAFFSPADRAALALSLNNLLASPTFASWLQGDSLDIARLLHNEHGKPCISIMSIAHLSDPQRMFFVSLLLNEVISWMRTQEGTSSLRALLYMDEVFGYFPPTENPPSKLPMLTLLKQARAFGLGVVLATQNPVDLDYKGLANAGTWFLGRLQTERDKLRVIEGLEGASVQAGKGFPRAEVDKILAGLQSRVFLMNNVHQDAPLIFETRWAMSYLRGPLTRDGIQRLTRESANAPAPPAAEPAVATTQAKTDLALTPAVGGTGLIPNGIDQFFVPVRRAAQSPAKLVYRAALYASAQCHFSKASCQVDAWIPISAIVEPRAESLPEDVWTWAHRFQGEWETQPSPPTGAEFSAVPEAFQRSKSFSAWEKNFSDYLVREHALRIWYSPDLKQYSRVGEDADPFRQRLEQQATASCELEIQKLRQSYGAKLQTLDDRIRRAEEKVSREKEQYRRRWFDSVLRTGSAILGAVFGRKRLSSTNVGRAATSVRSYGRAASAKDEIGRAEDSVETLRDRRAALESEQEAAVLRSRQEWRDAATKLEEIQIRPRKSGIQVSRFGILWLPYFVSESGAALPAYESLPSA